MTREEFIKQRCEIDKITEEVFEKNYRVVECNCGQLYCKGYRCLDLDDLLKENQELKKQLEELNRFKFSCKKDETQIPTTIYNKKTVEDISKIKSQQKAFIKYLEDEIEDCELTSDLIFNHNKEMKIYKEILQKYKKIIGED